MATHVLLLLLLLLLPGPSKVSTPTGLLSPLPQFAICLTLSLTLLPSHSFSRSLTPLLTHFLTHPSGWAVHSSISASVATGSRWDLSEGRI
jgi:hypothetical protein